jgi:hypothetical protein
MTDKAPMFFDARLGGLFPANAKAEEVMRQIKGRVRVRDISGGIANQRRRGLYWSVLALVVPLLNDVHNLTLDDDDLHDITRAKLRHCDDIVLPSGELHRKLRSTSNRAMNEATRAAFTDSALHLWSTWTGIDVTTLRSEAEMLVA